MLGTGRWGRGAGDWALGTGCWGLGAGLISRHVEVVAEIIKKDGCIKEE